MLTLKAFMLWWKASTCSDYGLLRLVAELSLYKTCPSQEIWSDSRLGVEPRIVVNFTLLLQDRNRIFDMPVIFKMIEKIQAVSENAQTALCLTVCKSKN